MVNFINLTLVTCCSLLITIACYGSNAGIGTTFIKQEGDCYKLYGLIKDSSLTIGDSLSIYYHNQSAYGIIVKNKSGSSNFYIAELYGINNPYSAITSNEFIFLEKGKANLKVGSVSNQKVPAIEAKTIEKNRLPDYELLRSVSVSKDKVLSVFKVNDTYSSSDKAPYLVTILNKNNNTHEIIGRAYDGVSIDILLESKAKEGFVEALLLTMNKAEKVFNILVYFDKEKKKYLVKHL